MEPRRSRLRGPHALFRWGALGAMLVALAPAFAGADSGNVPVVTKIAGTLSVRPANGATHEVGLLQPLHDGDVIVTGPASSADLTLAGVADIRLGAGTMLKVLAPQSGLSLRLIAGTICVQADGQVAVSAIGVALNTTRGPAAFDAAADLTGTKLAVQLGAISATTKSQTFLVNAGNGLSADANGNARSVSIASLAGVFVQCPLPKVAQNSESPAPSPQPEPTAQVSSGGGGGGGFGWLLGLLAIGAAASGHGGGGGSSTTPPPPPPPTPGTLGVTPGVLAFPKVSSPAQTFQAAEPSYTGAINATTENTGVATVSPPSGTGPSTTFTVTPTGPGTTKIDVTDNHGQNKKVAITVQGPLQVNPGSLIFDLGGGTQQFLASEAFFAGTITATSENSGVASVAPPSGSGPNVTFTVTPVAIGSTAIDVSDGTNTTKVTITVNPQGSLMVNPNALTLLAGGPSETFTGSESHYRGPINAASSDQTMATVSPASSPGPGPVTFTVTPLQAGNPSIHVTDNHGGSQNVALTITGPLTANPTSLSFLGTTTPQTFNASDPNFSGTISAQIDKPSVATVTPSGSGPNAMFTVTPVAQGNATITVTDPNGGTTTVTVSVSTGNLVLNPTSIAVRTGGTNTFTASEANFSGQFFAASSNTNKATVAPAQGPGPGPFTFTVTGIAAGNPSISVTDTHTPPQFVDVAVTGPLTTTPTSLTFDGSSTNSQPFTANDPNNSGNISITNNSNPNIASVNPLVGSGASVIFQVTPLTAGSTTLSLADAQGATASEQVTVNTGPLTLSVTSMTFNSPSAPAQTSIASENFYPGPINESDNCTGVATVSPQSGTSPVTFTVTPAATGVCAVTVTDNHSGSRQISVTVFGVLQANPSSLLFTDVGSGNNQTFIASESNFSGTISADATLCSGVATVSPASGNAPVTFTVTPVAAGGPCSINVTDGHGQSAQVSVTVGPFGSVVAAPNSLSFGDVGPPNAKTFMVSESGYSGLFTIDPSACAGAVSVSPLSGDKTTTFTVTPNSSTAGCNIKASDDHGQSANVNAVVGPFGPVVNSPPSFTFIGAGQVGTVNVSETNYTGTFTAADNPSHPCASAGIATISGSSPSFTVTSGSNPGNCAFLISDDHGSSAEVTVFDTTGTLTVNPTTIGFADITTLPTPAPFTASDPNNPAASNINAVSSNNAVATVACFICLGTSVQFTVTPVGNGTATITVTDGVAGSQAAVSIGVGTSPLVKKKHPVPPRKVLPTPGPVQPIPVWPPGGGRPGGSLTLSNTIIGMSEIGDTYTVLASDPGWTGPLSALSTNSRIATAQVLAAGPGTWSIIITAHALGTTTINVAAGAGQPRMILVRVMSQRPFNGIRRW